MSQTNGGKMILRIGSRKSKLALIQTEEVIKRLKQHYSDDLYEYKIITMDTTGDNNLNSPLAEIGEKALFTKELEEKLLCGDIDFIVHSMKDLPTTLPEGCSIGAVLEREDPNDVFVLKNKVNGEKPITLTALMQSGTTDVSKPLNIGTSSLRRIAQLKYYTQQYVKCINIRGNLNTRFAKLDNKDSDFDALLLASAGIQRLGFEDRITETLNSEHWFYAVGQGALAVECRDNDEFILSLLTPLFHFKTCYECLCERTVMKLLEGGCSVPIGVRCAWQSSENETKESKLTLSAAVFSLDGSRKVEYKHTIDLNENIELKDMNFTGIALPSKSLKNYEEIRRKYLNSYRLGAVTAEGLKERGAVQILDEIRQGKMKSIPASI